MERGDSTEVSLGISSEEFEHYQRRFIEERSEKYALLEKVRKLEQENARLLTEKSSEKDLDRILKDKKPLQNLLHRSKRDSESDINHHDDALQKRLRSQEEDFQRQNALLMQELQQLIIKNEELEHRLKNQDSSNANENPESEALIRSLQAELSLFRHSRENEAPGEQVPNENNSSKEHAFKLSSLMEEISSLQQRIKSDQTNFQQKLLVQEKAAASLFKDLEAKQTSVTLLLAEKDQMQRNFTERLSLLIAEKDSLKTAFKFDLDKLSQENARLKQDMEDERTLAKTRIDDVERQMKDLLEQLDVTSQQTRRDQDELLSEHKKQIASLLGEVEILTVSRAVLQQQNAEQSASLQTLHEERTQLVTSQAENERLAEKRKATIEDLTKHLETLKAEHNKELEGIRRETSHLIKDLESRLLHANEEIMRLGDIAADFERNSHHLSSLQREHEKFKQESIDKIIAMQEAKDMLQNELETFRAESKSTIFDLSDKVRDMSAALAVATAENESLTAQLAKKVGDSEQMLHDKNEELRIVERKNAGTLRDLQKQLHSEKKRVEKLQNRLNEVLKDSGIKPRSFTDDTDFTEREETGSNASWSFVSPKGNGKKAAVDNVSNHSNQENETRCAPVITDQETRELVGRVARLQQDKAALMERIGMLETGSAAMAEDLLNKSALIDRYLQQAPVPGHVQHSKDDVFSLKKVIDHLGRDKSIDVETQKNLRRLLEETLTKNIHLQKNMELLTEELDRLRGSSPPR